MSRIRGKNTGPEREMFRLLRRQGVYFARHGRELPGSPDIVFRKCRLAVFIDGDFWHGRKLSSWRKDLSAFWREKIEANVRRDNRDRRRLRSLDWDVVRIWGKDLARDPDACVRTVLDRRRECIASKMFKEVSTNPNHR